MFLLFLKIKIKNNFNLVSYTFDGVVDHTSMYD